MHPRDTMIESADGTHTYEGALCLGKLYAIVGESDHVRSCSTCRQWIHFTETAEQLARRLVAASTLLDIEEIVEILIHQQVQGVWLEARVREARRNLFSGANEPGISSDLAASRARCAIWREQIEEANARDPQLLADRLATIVGVYLDANFQLWGFPYRMRPGQQPRDITEGPTGTRTFTWIKGTRWYGNRNRAEVEIIDRWVADVRATGCLPESPFEWCYLDPDPVVEDVEPLAATG